MKKKVITKVLFLQEENPDSILAVFPDIKDGRGKVACYSHHGQHAGATLSYYKGLSPASRQEYRGLYNELKKAGYNLEVLNDLPSEPIKCAITSENEGRTFIIFHDGGIKIIDQSDYGRSANVMNIEPVEMDEIITAIQKQIGAK